MKKWLENFAEKHPKAAQWIREGGLFLVFSYIVTFIKWALLTFLQPVFENLIGLKQWLWPNIPAKIAGIPFNFSIIGNTLNELNGELHGGLAFTVANLITIFFGECINFPCQRSITFRSKGPMGLQACFHFLATLAVFLVMNLFTNIWNPLTAHFNIPQGVANIVTTIVTGGVAMVIIFAVDKTIFAPGFGEKKEAK